jgi:hydroxymethylbilane synthase
MTSRPLRLGTRGSPLALFQARAVASLLTQHSGVACDTVIIRTSGDRLADAPLSEIGGKRLFVKEIEDALLGGTIDLAVHSSKDMSVVLPDGLAIAGVLPRENPLDAVVLPALSPQPSALTSVEELARVLGDAPSIGTGSVRRIAQLTRLFPGARFAGIRGNLDTRLRKLDEGAHDAIVLAAAGLTRLGFGSRISLSIPCEACVPSPGQGIVAIEIRGEDARARDAVARINDADAGDALAAERALVARLGGGCQTPVGALASIGGQDRLDMSAAVVALDGRGVVRARARAPRGDAAALGARVGAQLLADGADDILAEAQQVQGAKDTQT